MLQRLHEQTGGLHLEIRELEEDGDAVMIEFLGLMGPEENRSAQLGWATLLVKDGRIVETDTYPNLAGARAAFERLAGGTDPGNDPTAD